MHNIGVIGDYDGICGFSSVGFDVFPVSCAEEARKELITLANSGYGIIYITERYMKALADDCAKYDDKMIPCIIPLPDGSGTGYGEQRLKGFVEQAVGRDSARLHEPK